MNLEQKFRAEMINSITGFKSLALIGTKDKRGNTNLAIFNSLVHIGSNPPLIGFISRPKIEERHTVKNIFENSFYTINHIPESIYINAHQTSARYTSEISEFEATELTEEYINDFYAPFVKESNIKMGVVFKEKVLINSNDTCLIVGEIRELIIPDNCLGSDGFVDICKAESIAGSGLDTYYTTQKIARLTYAKPNVKPTIIS
jgi:flavin reductase (DIM6/NTAB) family NADH-FMN oxidoreductase RutF